MKKIKAYKVFSPDWTCKGFQYEVGKSYHEDNIKICKKGFHACLKLSDCFSYYDFDKKNKVAEVELSGEIQRDNSFKCCASDITIVKELPWEEVLTLCNSGNCNSGNGNSGDCNSGNSNSGNRNSGDWNSGNGNSGDSNSGNWNSGNWNSGDWNSGFFNTKEQKVVLFNQNTGMNRKDINFPLFLYFDLTVWVSHDTATEKEKKEHKQEIETCGGFLKVLDYKEAFKLAWDNASEKEHEQVKQLPNFDADIFYEISGIDLKDKK